MKIPFVFKKCGKCGRWLVASTVNFYKEERGKYGLRGECKDCRNAYRRKLREDNNKLHKKECPDGYKKCTKCGRVLLANSDNFGKNKGGKYGLQSQCKDCYNANNRDYYKENIKKERARSKKYNEAHREEIREQQRKYDAEHREEKRKRYKEYYKTPQGQIVAFNGRIKRRQKEEQQGDGVTKEQWLEMMKYFEFKCAYSGITLNTNNRSIDHIVPLAKGGAHEIWNCVPMDRGLNCGKRDKDLEEWYPQQDFYNEDRLNKIKEWHKYAYNKWGNKVNTKTI